MFQLTTIDLGEIKVGVEKTIEFFYGQDISYIKKITSPCVCTGVSNDSVNRKIIAKYIPSLPTHLGVQEIDKQFNIEVEYVSTDGTDGHQTLTFKAKIKA